MDSLDSRPAFASASDMPVSRYNGRLAGDGWPGPIIRQLIQAWCEMVGLHIVAQAKAYAQVVVPFQVLQGGLLTGKYRRREGPADSRQVGKSEWALALTEELFDRLEQLEAAARARQRTLLQHILLALFEQPAVVSLIVGAKRIDQLEDSLRRLPTS